MRVATTQLCNWRKYQGDEWYFLDTTIKSGNKAFAPSWDMVMAVKSKEMDEETYKRRFYYLMMQSIQNHKRAWEELLERSETIVVSCYCSKDTFCHRHLLVDILKRICKKAGKPFEYIGEL